MPIFFSILLLWLWACWMVTSQNMAASHGNACPLSFLPSGWCRYMEAGDKAAGEKVAEIWREAWVERPSGEAKSQEKRRRRRQKREERDSEEGHQLGEKDLEERGRDQVLKQPRAFSFFLLKLESHFSRRKSVFGFLGSVLLENSCGRALFRTRCSGKSHKDSSCHRKGWSTSGSGP